MSELTYAGLRERRSLGCRRGVWFKVAYCQDIFAVITATEMKLDQSSQAHSRDDGSHPRSIYPTLCSTTSARTGTQPSVLASI